MKHILIVDDDDDMRSMVARWLAREYSVTEAASGEEALALLSTQRPDLVLLDYLMPDMSGMDTLRAMRERDGLDTLAVAFLTGADDLDLASPEVAALHPVAAWSKALGKRPLLEEIAQYFARL